MPPLYKFRVLMRRDDGPDSDAKTVEVESFGRHLAARAAEAGNFGWKAIAVSATWQVIGVCEKCQSVIFRDEQSRKGRPMCVDCG